MACISCQERRKAIARIAASLGGTIVFGAKRMMAAPPEKPKPEKPDQDQKNGQPRT